MAKSIRSKIKKRFRSIKRQKLAGWYLKKANELADKQKGQLIDGSDDQMLTSPTPGAAVVIIEEEDSMVTSPTTSTSSTTTSSSCASTSKSTTKDMQTDSKSTTSAPSKKIFKSAPNKNKRVGTNRRNKKFQ